MAEVDIDAAIFNPSSVFKTPEEVTSNQKITLTREQQIRALQTWLYDIQLRRVAEEENMHSNQDQKDMDLEISILKSLETLKKS